MMAACASTKANGEPCRGIAGASNDWCAAHDPGRAAARRRSASKAGKSKPSAEIRAVKDRLLALADDVLGEVVDRGDGAVVAQILNVYLRACETERRTQDLGDLLERLEHVEAAASRLRGA